MKRKIMYLLVCSAILIAGCTEEEIMSNYPIADGDEIIFDASAGYPTSRTIYDDYVPGSGNQGISWIDGDQVSIYSPTSPNTTQVDYEVKTSSGVSNTAVLGKIDPEKVGLQWGGNPQKFYAVYPAKQQIQNEAVKELVDFKEGVLTGYIPINQTHEILGKEGLVWKTKPVMEYSYMVAKQTVSEADRVNGVDLNFMPISSAIDVTLKGDGQNTVKISSINIVSQSEQLTGQFTCDLKGWSDKLIYPDCVIKSDDLSRNRVTVDLRYGDNNYIELGPNEQITLTVFLMPQDKLTDLVLRLSAFNMSAKELPLGSLGVEIVPHKKSMVTAKVPVWGKDEVNEWMSGIDDRTYISQLSIPGTANSASYNYGAADAQYYKTQTATIEEQLNAGVRCFELRCTEGSGNDLSTAPLQCNRQNVGMTFGGAMRKFETFLKYHPTEFLMVMPAYESNSGTGGAKSFVQRLNEYLKSTKTSPIVDGRPRYSVYNPEITLGEVRGSIMIIARVTTEEYDEGTLTEIKKLGIEKGVVIEKWGSLKDMWGRRGYSFDGINRIPDYATSYKSWGVSYVNQGSMEYEMLNGNTTSGFTPANLPSRTLNPSFTHATYRSDGSESTEGAYVQDWARVVQKTQNYKINGSGLLHDAQYAYWQESCTEKENDIWDTFLKAVEDNKGKNGTYFYINCIDGYFVSDKIINSAIPYVESHTSGGLSYTNGGVAGDIEGFANHFNDYFYNKLVEYGAYNIAGSMNVVMLDRVLDGVAGSNIVQMIVDNNFKFPLLTNPNK